MISLDLFVNGSVIIASRLLRINIENVK